MKILLLAPHPFYQERGTPIAVNLLLKSLSARGDTVDVVTYHEGTDVSYPNVTLHRIAAPPGVRHIRPGFSLKKLVCDLYMLGTIRRLMRQNRYDVVHAVEESAFIAMWIRRRYGVPYLFDMDSSMPLQMMEKNGLFRAAAPLLRGCEGAAIARALAVVPVCDALADIARANRAHQIFLLRDISLLSATPPEQATHLRQELHAQGTCFMYIGNLEPYQGIDLLLESFAILVKSGAPTACVVIVGGTPATVSHYQAKAETLGIGPHVHFAGPRPIALMASLFQEADVLVSPRVKGNNTPMKVYSYLQSGKPVLATDLPTHTQVLTPDVALLAAPAPELFAAAMRLLLDHPEEGQRKATAALQLANTHYSPAAFDRTVRDIYHWVERQLITHDTAAPQPTTK